MRNTRPHVGPPESGTSWEGEDFARVEWDWTELERVTFVDCRFDDASLLELVTRRCVFERCVLTGFPGATLRPMTATGCDWSYASLRGVDLSGVDLSGQRLTEADLTDTDLREADLSGADLRHARLQGTLLRGADLRGAVTDGVNWRGFDPTGVRLDLGQAVQFARSHGAVVEG
jgi:uncharacterized protein YjbI with pentapeptide repeats